MESHEFVKLAQPLLNRFLKPQKRITIAATLCKVFKDEQQLEYFTEQYKALNKFNDKDKFLLISVLIGNELDVPLSIGEFIFKTLIQPRIKEKLTIKRKYHGFQK